MHAQSHPTLCHHKDSPGSSVHGILQARILEWIAVPSSRDLPDPGIKLASPALQVDSLPLSHWGKHRDCDAHQIFYFFLDVSKAPCLWGRPSDYFHQKKGQLWCRLLSHSGSEKLSWDSQVLSCLSWTLAVFRKLSLMHPGLWVETWSWVPHPNIAKQTYV